MYYYGVCMRSACPLIGRQLPMPFHKPFFVFFAVCEKQLHFEWEHSTAKLSESRKQLFASADNRCRFSRMAMKFVTLFPRNDLLRRQFDLESNPTLPTHQGSLEQNTNPRRFAVSTDNDDDDNTTSNQQRKKKKKKNRGLVSDGWNSNPRPFDLQSNALPLSYHHSDSVTARSKSLITLLHLLKIYLSHSKIPIPLSTLLKRLYNYTAFSVTH